MIKIKTLLMIKTKIFTYDKNQDFLLMIKFKIFTYDKNQDFYL